MRNGNGFFFEGFFGRILNPFERFLRKTTAGGIVLAVVAISALILANSPVGTHIDSLWEQSVRIGVADWTLELRLREWVNEGLMTLFFLLVGLELKRELIVGELASFKDAALPVVAALGGMIVPALIYLVINHGGPAVSGWGIPMATDIAFSVGILVVLSSRIPSAVIIFLTALAIADDLGAVLVIAVFYTAQISLPALVCAAFVFLILLVLNRGGIRHPLPYAFLGVALWLAFLKSGVHPTIAGVLLSCSIPAKSTFAPPQFAKRIDQLQSELLEGAADPYGCEHALGCPHMIAIAENLERASRAVQSPLQRMENTLSPWVTFVVLPVFAFSNMTVGFAELPSAALSNSVTLGILLGLIPGKLIGIFLFTWIAMRLGLGRLPKAMNTKHLAAIGCLAGIGFTMSIFISNLAFTQRSMIDEAKVGILAASMISGLIGSAWLYFGEKSSSSR
jgi:NhaA family Na+:H+ antiporter